MITRADIDRELFGRMSALERGRKDPKHIFLLQADASYATEEAKYFRRLLKKYQRALEGIEPKDKCAARYSLSSQCVVLAAECLLLAYALEGARS